MVRDASKRFFAPFWREKKIQKFSKFFEKFSKSQILGKIYVKWAKFWGKIDKYVPYFTIFGGTNLNFFLRLEMLFKCLSLKFEEFWTIWWPYLLLSFSVACVATVWRLPLNPPSYQLLTRQLKNRLILPWCTSSYEPTKFNYP